MRILAGFTTIALLLNLVFSSVLAQTGRDEAQEEKVVMEVNSFEAFWPLVAGRTMDDSLYFLKNLKEKVRGFFIFGQAQKADYNVFLGTKRVLEAEKLLKEGKTNSANKTLEIALTNFRGASGNIDKVLQEGELGGTTGTTASRLENLEVLLSWYSSKGDNEKIDEVLNEIKNLRAKLRS